MKRIDLVIACPHCRHTTAFARPIDGVPAVEPGNVTVCVRCGRWAVIDRSPAGELVAREPAAEERAAVRASPSWPLLDRACKRIVAMLGAN